MAIPKPAPAVISHIAYINEIDDLSFLKDITGLVFADICSGREINKLVIAWQSAAYGNTNAFIDEAMMRKVLAESKESKRQKKSVDAILIRTPPVGKIYACINNNRKRER